MFEPAQEVVAKWDSKQHYRAAIFHKKKGIGRGKHTADWRKEGGKRLRIAREARGLTLREVEMAFPAISKSRLNHYEMGIRGMTPDVADLLAKFYGVNAAYLLCVDDCIPNLPEMTNEIAWLVARWTGSGKQVRDIVRGILERATDK